MYFCHVEKPMKMTWDEVRKLYPNWEFIGRLWQHVGGRYCSRCGLDIMRTAVGLRIVKGYEYEKICRKCYWMKHTYGDHWNLIVDELANERLTDDKGNYPLDNWIIDEEE